MPKVWKSLCEHTTYTMKAVSNVSSVRTQYSMMPQLFPRSVDKPHNRQADEQQSIFTFSSKVASLTTIRPSPDRAHEPTSIAVYLGWTIE